MSLSPVIVYGALSLLAHLPFADAGGPTRLHLHLDPQSRCFHRSECRLIKLIQGDTIGARTLYRLPCVSLPVEQSPAFRHVTPTLHRSICEPEYAHFRDFCRVREGQLRPFHRSLMIPPGEPSLACVTELDGHDTIVKTLADPKNDSSRGDCATNRSYGWKQDHAVPANDEAFPNHSLTRQSK